MEIANPIYDVVFKYLMEDNEVAKLFISAITGLDIITLDFLPQELAADKDSKAKTIPLNLSIYRLDFSARIRQADGSEKVIIVEIQKSKFNNESMRFRKYLGKQYMNSHFFEWIVEASGQKYKNGTPILPIYFLGKKVVGLDDNPVILVEMVLKDRYTQNVIEERNHFINSLFHEGIIINIPALSEKRRDELEMLLSIFVQSNKLKNPHIMRVTETDFPKKFRPIIRRLQAAIQEKQVRDIMTVEDDFISELNEYERRILEETKLKEEAVRKQEEERKQKEEAVRKQEEERRQKEEAVRRQEEAIKLLLGMGMPREQIAQQLGLSLESIAALENSGAEKNL